MIFNYFENEKRVKFMKEIQINEEIKLNILIKIASFLRARGRGNS